MMSGLTSKYRTRGAAGIALAILGLASHGQTAYAGVLSYRVYQQAFDPAKPALSVVKQAGALPGGLSSDVTKAWKTYGNQATPVFVQNLSKANLVKSGYTLYNVKLNLGDIDSIQLLQRDPAGGNSIPPVDANHPMIVVTSTQARLDANSTTPYTSHDTDPSFHLTFDVTVLIHLSLGPRASEVSVAGGVVNLSNSQYFPDNATAKEGQVFDALGSVVGQKSMDEKITSAVDSVSIKITEYLRGAMQQANDQLRSVVYQQEVAANQNLAVAGIFSDSAGLSFVVAPVLTPNANGQMRGTLTVIDESVAKTAHAGTNDCANSFLVHDQVQVQPRYVASLNPTTFLNVDPPAAAIDPQVTASFGASAPTANGWTCEFVINGLAQDFANQISFYDPGATGSAAAALSRTLSVDFKSCARAAGGPSASYRDAAPSFACATKLRVCGNPLQVPTGANPTCDLVAKLETKGSNIGAVVRQNARQPFMNTGDPAARERAPGDPAAVSGSKARNVIKWGAAQPASGVAQSAVAQSGFRPAARSGVQTNVAQPALRPEAPPSALPSR